MNKNCNNISSQRNKYSIRKLTVGTASLLIGATLVFGLGNEAYADELASQEKNNTVANSNENSEPHKQQKSTTDEQSQNQSVQEQETQEQTAQETKKIDEGQQSTNENTNSPSAIQHENIDENVTNENISNEDQQNKEEALEKQGDAINKQEESVLTEHKPEETKQQITEAEASIDESEQSTQVRLPNKSDVNNSTNKPQIIRQEQQKNENTKESRKVNDQVQLDKKPGNKKLKKVVGTHESTTRSLKRAKRQATSTRDKTEDASLETLDYSDNYTFQTLIFDPEKLIDNNILKGNRIPFKIHSYMIGANSGDRYKINLQLDEVLANHITKVSAIPANQSTPVEFTRLENAIGRKTNIWQVNYIRANNGLFGGAEILSQYTAEGGVIELDDTVENILNAQADLSADKLNYLIYVKDAQENKKIRTSETSGYFLTKAENSFTDLKKSTSDAANNAFKASCGSVQFDASIGEYGAFVGDQQILKNGILNYGGPLLDSGLNKQWTYHYKIDPKLLPFVGQIELHKYDFKGLSGFDKTYYEDTRVALLPVNSNGEGSITSFDLNSIIEFNNSLPETVGIRIVVKFNQTPNNILIRDAKFDDYGNLIANTSKVKEEFTFYGYLTDRFGGLIKNTFGTSTYYIQDIDKDGLTDNFEIHSSHTDPFNPDTDNDGNTDGNEFMNLRTSPLVAKPVVQDVTTDMNVIKGNVHVLDGATEQEVKIMDSQNKEIGNGKLERNGDFNIKVSNLKPGQYTAHVISSKYKNPEKTTFNAVDITVMLKPAIEEVNETDLDISVTGIEGSTVTVKDSKGKFIGRVNIAKGQTGAFIKLKQPLSVGTVLIATAKKGKNTSVPSDPVTVIDSASIDAPIVNPLSNRDSSVTGTTEPNAIIRVVLPNDMEILSKGDENGRFDVLLPDDYKLKVGEKIEVIAISGKGISSEATSVTVQGYVGFPVVQAVTSESKTITGIATSGSLISVKLPDGTLLYGKATDSGDFDILLPDHIKFTGGERIELSAISQPGNFALSTPIIVQDLTPPEAPTVNEVTSESSKISGTAEVGSTVKVQLPDGSELIDVANYQGNYTIDIPSDKKFQGGERIKVTSTDASGNKSNETVIDVKDTIPPVAPTASEVTSESTQVTGTGEPGSTVKVELPDGTVLSEVADDQGNYVIDIPANKKFQGGESIKVTSTDASGNKSNETVIDVKDTTPPVAPTVSEVTSESTQVTGTGEPGSTIKVELPDGSELSGVADDQGNYTVDLPANKKFQGGERIKVTSTDGSGNKSNEAVIDVKDTTPPVAPTVSEVTSESTQVTGTGEPGSTVKVELPDGTELTGVIDDQGNYAVALPSNKKFQGGENIKVTSTDPSGNKSNEMVIDVKDTTPPVAPTVSEVTSESTQVTGTSEPGSTVKVELPDGTELSEVADDQGNYTVGLPANKKFRGGESIKVTSTDASGNKSNETVIDVKDTTPPVAPMVSEVTSESTQVTGTSEPGSTVKVELPDGTELTGVVDDQGNYTIDIPSGKKFEGGEQLKVISIDVAGNKSKEISVEVRDVTPPKAPTVNEIASKHSRITGTAEVESEVKIELPDGTKLTGMADDQGNYSIDIPNGKEFQGGEQLKVTSTDISGNESQITNIVVKDTTPPFAPLVEIVTSEGNQIRGASESESIVKVELPDGTKLTGVANAIEKFAIDIPSDKKFQGGEVLKVTATDQSGNESLVTTINVKDTTPPNPPSVLPLTSENMQVSVVGEPGSTIKILLPDNSELIGQADNQGVSVIALPENKKFQGGERLRVTSTDATGNESQETVIEIIDVTPPEEPTVNPVSSESLQITGTSEPNATVKVIMPDGTELVNIANDQGEFTIDLTVSKKLQGGENLKITSIDATGNKSQEKTIKVKDTTPPLTPVVNPITSESTNIIGRAEPKATVKIELPDGTNLITKVDLNGNYTVDIPNNKKFQGGENIKISSIDEAGNKSQVITSTVKDVTPPTIPTISEVTSESSQVSGTSEPGSTIKLVLPDGTELSNVTDNQGNYVIDLPNVMLIGGEELSVTSTDITGNKSEVSKVMVKDVTAPEAPSVNSVTSENMSVTGISEPRSIVKVELPNGTELIDVANDQGEYTIDLSQIKLIAKDKLKVTATDAAGNKSEATTIEYKDVTPPIAPKVNQITSETTQITGSGEPNTAVKLELPNGLDLIAIINDQGNFSINLPSDYRFQGDEKVRVVGIDESLNISEEKIIRVQDVTPPKAPMIYPIASSSYSLRGMSEPEAQITLKLPNGKLLYGQVDKLGIYSVKVIDEYVFQGGETIEVTATDKSGNISEATTIIVDDDTPPSPPVIYGVTSESKAISGKTEPFATITVAVSYKDLIVGKANKKGEFNLPIPKGYNLDGGEEMRITSTDIAGNVSEKTYVMVKDVTAPNPPSALPITSESEEIIGKTEPNAIVTVKISNGNKFTENADDFGNYVINLPKNIKLNGGEKVQLKATDPSGNISEAMEIIVIDLTPPTVPTAKPLTSEDLRIVGTGEPQTMISVELPNGTRLLGKVDNKGNYVIDLPNKVNFNGGENIKIISTDKAGNMPLPLIMTVVDTTPPVLPKIDSFTTENKQLTGVTEPDAVVNVLLPTGENLSVKADDKGVFVINLPSGIVFKGGEKLSITAVDAQGNKTSPIIIIVKDTTIPEPPKVDKVTSESTQITGTGEPGAIVKVELPNGKLLTAQVDTQGTFNVNLPKKGTFKGGEVLKVSIVDPSSNESQSTTVHVEDITAPKSPTVKRITSDNPLIVGTAEVGSTIKVKLPNGKVISTKVDKQGNYKLKIPNNFKLNGGELLIITATDISGNTSDEVTVKVTVKVTDNTAPTKPSIHPIDKDSKKISGTAGANATIKIKLPNGKVIVGNTDSKGRFE